MAKRLFDSFKFDDPWYRKLTLVQKLFWEFLLCKCNHAGIWKPDFEMASFYIGAVVEQQEMELIFKERVVILEKGDWFVPKFIYFQYGDLNKNVKTHLSVIIILRKLGLNSYITVNKQLNNSYVAGKDKDKDKDKDVLKKGVVGGNKRFRVPTLEAIRIYCQENKSSVDPESFFNTYESSGWIKANGQAVKNWRATIKTWERRAEQGRKNNQIAGDNSNKNSGRKYEEIKRQPEPNPIQQAAVAKLISETARKMDMS